MNATEINSLCKFVSQNTKLKKKKKKDQALKIEIVKSKYYTIMFKV